LIYLLLLIPILSLWPSWQWLLQRSIGGVDEPLAPLALVTALLLIISKKREMRLVEITLNNLILPFCLLLAYALASLVAPKTIQLLLALSVVVSLSQALFCKRSLPLSLWIMVLLAVPSVATLEFYFGFPLRTFVAAGTAAMLNMCGLGVTSKGVQLFYMGKEIVIDSACSGIHMLWVSFYLAMILAYVRKLNTTCTSLLAAASACFAFTGNVMRAEAITIFEMSQWFRPQQQGLFHQGIGVGSFILVAAAIVFLAERLSHQHTLNSEVKPQTRPVNGAASPTAANNSLVSTSVFHVRLWLPLLTVSAIVMGLQMFGLSSQSTPKPTVGAEITIVETRRKLGWQNLDRISLNIDETKFASNFPGTVEKFADGNKSILMRVVRTETRQLHSSADCYKGNGYTVKPLSIIVDQNGFRWSRFDAQKDSRHFIVRECILDGRSGMWTDPSSWYWAALLGKTTGPWCFVTVAEPVTKTALAPAPTQMASSAAPN
jgi:exosortase/archaeosortase family protein